MNEIFTSADPLGYESRTRAVRLHGVITHLRLEQLVWDVLEEIARRDGVNVIHLIETLYDDLWHARGSVGDFAAFLRVSALRYEALMARGRIPIDEHQPLRTLNPALVLRELPAHWALPPHPGSGADATPARALQRAITRLPH